MQDVQKQSQLQDCFGEKNVQSSTYWGDAPMVNAETEFELCSEESFNKFPTMDETHHHCMRTTQIQGVEWKTISGKRHDSWKCNEMHNSHSFNQFLRIFSHQTSRGITTSNDHKTATCPCYQLRYGIWCSLLPKHGQASSLTRLNRMIESSNITSCIYCKI